MQIARACKSIIYYLVVRHVYKVFDGILILRLKHRKRILTALKEKKKTKNVQLTNVKNDSLWFRLDGTGTTRRRR